MKSPAPAPARRRPVDDPDEDAAAAPQPAPEFAGALFAFVDRMESRASAMGEWFGSKIDPRFDAAAAVLASTKSAIDHTLAKGRTLAGIKAVILFIGLVPALWLAGSIIIDPVSLGANPAEYIIRELGDWTLKFLLISLAVTPLRYATGINGLIKFRRMLGLFAFFYGTIHLASYLAFDRFFVFDEIVADVIKRPFITVGFAALVLMTPLAITSTKGWIRRMGAARWNRLHRVVYLVAILGVVHYWWLVKRDLTWPIIYAVILAMLLGYRVMRQKPAPRSRRHAAQAGEVAMATSPQPGPSGRKSK